MLLQHSQNILAFESNQVEDCAVFFSHLIIDNVDCLIVFVLFSFVSSEKLVGAAEAIFSSVILNII